MFFIKEKQMYPGEPLADQVDPSHGKTFPSFSTYPPRLPISLRPLILCYIGLSNGLNQI
jgi:hypothetical protein